MWALGKRRRAYYRSAASARCRRAGPPYHEAVPPPVVGDLVQTALGKGIVRELRRHGRLLVEVKGRTLELDANAVSWLEAHSAPSRRRAVAPVPLPAAGGPDRGRVGAQIDFHGLTVDEALARVEVVINDALLADETEVRLVHGRSGGRIRGALHRRLRDIPSVRAFRLDPRNPGVTIVML